MADVYEIVTDRIIERLEKGVCPWRKPWASGPDAFPKNLVSRKGYQGINTFLLAAAGYSNPYWLTYKQAQELGGNVRKGEKSSIVVFWKLYETNKQIETVNGFVYKTVPVLCYYNVFNADQCEGIESPYKATVRNNDPDIDACEKIVAGMPKRPSIAHGGDRAFYRPSADTVTVPAKAVFDGIAEYYSTLFHELGHSTGHASRLNRPGITQLDGFGSHEYSKEELVAEMTAAYLCGHTGIDNSTLDNSAAYLGNWLKVLKDY